MLFQPQLRSKLSNESNSSQDRSRDGNLTYCKIMTEKIEPMHEPFQSKGLKGMWWIVISPP